MGQDRLNGLAIMRSHQDIPVDPDRVIDDFARKHARRMEMINILISDQEFENTKWH